MELLLDLLRSVVYGVIEGITEWLPISSTGHMILAEQVLKFSFEDATYPPSCSVAVPDVDEPVRYRIISSVCPDVLYFCTEIFV